MSYSTIAAALLGASIVSLFWVFKTNLEVRSELRLQKAEMQTYTIALNKIGKELQKSNTYFEATDYTVKTLDDGRVEVTFLRRLGPKDPETTKDAKDIAQVRTVVMPAWMWTQATAETALKTSFEALEKAKKKEAEE